MLGDVVQREAARAAAPARSSRRRPGPAGPGARSSGTASRRGQALDHRRRGRGASRGITTSVNAGRLSTSGSPVRSNRMPRGAAMGRRRIRFLSDSSCKPPPSGSGGTQSWRADDEEADRRSAVARSRSRNRGATERAGRGRIIRATAAGRSGQASAAAARMPLYRAWGRITRVKISPSGAGIVEELEQREAREAVHDRGHDREAHGHDRPRDEHPARPQVTGDEAEERLGQGLHAERARPPRRPGAGRREARRAARLRRRSAAPAAPSARQGRRARCRRRPPPGPRVHWTSAPPLTAST